jgi:hypothetical protein
MRWPMAVIWSPGLRVSLSQPVPAMRLGLGPPEIVLTAEEPTPEWTQKLGQAPPIYSAEINYCLDGLALGQLTPGPVVMLAAFVGYHVAAITGAVVAAAAVFLPSFALVLLTIPILQRTRQHPWLQAALRGVNPAVIGVIAVALLKMVPVAMPDLPRAALAVVTVLVMLRWSISPPLLIFAGAVLGLALGR